MIATLSELLIPARAAGYAVAAFNVYNLEGVRAVTRAASKQRSPVVLQVLPSAVAFGGAGLLGLMTAEAANAPVPVAVHLDHSTDLKEIESALDAGVSSVMADGSALDYDQNAQFVRDAVMLARAVGASVEAELGRLTGSEEGLTPQSVDGHLTDPAQAAKFARDTGVDALAVCIGNVHGPSPSEPELDYERLEAIVQGIDTPLVLHGGSGLSEDAVRRIISTGICKLNVNSDLRNAHLRTVRNQVEEDDRVELLPLMQATTTAMEIVAAEKFRLFGSAGRGL